MKTCLNTRAGIGLSLILCAALYAWPGKASAEPAGVTPGAATDGLAPHEILAMVRSSGFDPVSRPVRSGRTFILRALDRYELELNLVVDARTGRVLSASEAAVPRDAARRGPAYGSYAAPVYARIFGSPEAGFGSPRPPRTVPGSHDVPGVAGVKPQEKAAAPLPRPRPYVMEATGSVPATADTTVVQPNPAPAPAPAEKQNGGASMPPIAPLD